MSKEGGAANISRKRLNGSCRDRPSRTKRTPAQLAHLEELVEDKKPGSLSGSFSVFELAPPEPKAQEKVPQKIQLTPPKARDAMGPNQSTIPKPTPVVEREAENTTPEFVHYQQPDEHVTTIIPNIRRSSLQSIATIRPISDLRTNRIAGVICDTDDASVPVPIMHQQAPAYDLNASSPHGTSSLLQLLAAFPDHDSFPIRARAVSNPSVRNPRTGALSYLEPLSLTPHALSDAGSSSPLEHTIMEESWKRCRQSLILGPKNAELAHLKDHLSEDIPIRAVLHGWDSIGERWELPLFWQAIRQLDENQFYLHGPVERMALCNAGHLLMRYYSDPTAERAAALPKFYNSKSIDFERDYFLGNFLPWPGIREMTKNPLHPCRSNKWYLAELSTFQLLWPHTLQDCFTRSPESGLFKFTEEFTRRARDINYWTFGVDMFEEFPMVFGSAPCRGSIPGAVGLVGGRGGAVGGKRPLRRCIEYSEEVDEEVVDEEVVDASGIRRGGGGRERAVRDGIRTLVGENSLAYHNLHWREGRREGKRLMYVTLW